MSPEQLRQLHQLSKTFSEGHASHLEIRQLSALLAEMNFNNNNKQVDIETLNSAPIAMLKAQSL